MNEKREKRWIDSSQTKLSLYIGFYFAFYQIAVWAIIGFERHIAASTSELLGSGSLSASTVLLTAFVVGLGALFIYDAIKLSHRFIGPIHRFRKTIEAIKAGEEIALVRLRPSDFLEDMKNDLNELLKILEERGAVTLIKSQGKEGLEKADPALTAKGTSNETHSFPRNG